MKVIVDCNTLVSAALRSNSPPDRVVTFVMEHHVFLSSDEVFAEFSEVIHRPKFRKYISPSIVEAFVENLATILTLVQPKEKIDICRDPKDNMYLELAIAGQADCIVTGDKALLDLHPFRNVPIISPAEFVRQFI
ncbi:MAG: putative toxin-antitoxin system toxin component, PIN family [Imperialibacter sp.]